MVAEIKGVAMRAQRTVWTWRAGRLRSKAERPHWSPCFPNQGQRSLNHLVTVPLAQFAPEMLLRGHAHVLGRVAQMPPLTVAL